MAESNEMIAIEPAIQTGRIKEPKMYNYMDVNLFATRKTVAQGMLLLDFSLLASNISELKYLLQEKQDLSYYIATVCLIISIILQEPILKKSKSMDINLYATKKTIAEGMLDIALLTSNASQLKYLLQESMDLSYYIIIACLGISIILQVVVGILLLFNAKYNINVTQEQSRAELITNLTTVGVFFIAVVNILASTFVGSKKQ